MGKSSQGKPISFVVVKNALTSYKVEVQAPGCSFTFEAKGGTATAIKENAFQSTTKMLSTTVLLTGLFSSPTTASGTLEVEDKGQAGLPGCGKVQAKWTAEKQ